jgi:hypothetical protein
MHLHTNALFLLFMLMTFSSVCDADIFPGQEHIARDKAANHFQIANFLECLSKLTEHCFQKRSVGTLCLTMASRIPDLILFILS